MCHASLRYDGTRTISEIERGGVRLTGRTSAPKIKSYDAKKFICPLESFDNCKWADPIIQFRESYRKRMTFAPLLPVSDRHRRRKDNPRNRGKKDGCPKRISKHDRRVRRKRPSRVHAPFAPKLVHLSRSATRMVHESTEYPRALG